MGLGVVVDATARRREFQCDNFSPSCKAPRNISKEWATKIYVYDTHNSGVNWKLAGAGDEGGDPLCSVMMLRCFVMSPPITVIFKHHSNLLQRRVSRCSKILFLVSSSSFSQTGVVKRSSFLKSVSAYV